MADNTENGTKIDLLTEDPPIYGQKFVCMSFLSPENVKNCKIRGCKVRGVFDTYDEAKAHSEKLRNIDPLFDVFVGEVGKWLPIDPDPHSVKETNYYENQLNRLMEGYRANQEKGKTEELARRRNMLNQSLDDVLKNRKDSKKQESQIDRMRRKLEEKKNAKELDDMRNTQFRPKGDETVDLEVNNTDTSKLEENGKNEIKSIDENLEKMKELYKTMKKE